MFQLEDSDSTMSPAKVIKGHQGPPTCLVVSPDEQDLKLLML